jgi:hypothetical protein
MKGKFTMHNTKQTAALIGIPYEKLYHDRWSGRVAKASVAAGNVQLYTDEDVEKLKKHYAPYILAKKVRDAAQ